MLFQPDTLFLLAKKRMEGNLLKKKVQSGFPCQNFLLAELYLVIILSVLFTVCKTQTIKGKPRESTTINDFTEYI